jgi:cellulose synthase/poly-beta-1,6-N-acetylglucosamine synthase-like glycosyltransferase
MGFSTLLHTAFWAAWGLVAFTYIGFPVLLALMAEISARRSGPRTVEPLPDCDLPRVAMVVAAYNEEAVLPAKLANTWQLDYPSHRLDVLIGSDGSSDSTGTILRRCSDDRLRSFVFSERRGKISVLNDLMAHTDADIVVMSDANTLYSPDAIRKLVAHFQDPCVGCVSGELTLDNDGGASGEGLYWRYESWIKRNESRLGFLIGCNGGIFSLRRALYDPLPASTIVEDFVLTLRILQKGYRVLFAPEARATEPACVTSRAEMTRKIRIGAGGWQALGLTRALLHPRYGTRAFAFWGHKVLRWLVPLVFLVAIVINVVLLQHPIYQILFAVQLLGALVALWAYRAGPGSPLPKWTRPISYFFLMNYALGCGFARFIFGTQRVTWDRGAPTSPPTTNAAQFTAAAMPLYPANATDVTVKSKSARNAAREPAQATGPSDEEDCPAERCVNPVNHSLVSEYEYMRMGAIDCPTNILSAAHDTNAS